MLASLARRLNREAGRPPPPPLFFLIDRQRTPDPLAIVARLPRGAGVIYRHFGAADRIAMAKALARLCRRRRLILLIGADPALARLAGADGVHLPERQIGLTRALPARWLTTVAVHSRQAIARATAAGADAALISPVFPSNSPSAGRTLGIYRAARLARQAGLPVYALGGVNARTGKRLIGRGFAGLAAVEALA